MGFTTPRTWVAGETHTAAQLNAHVRDNINALVVVKGAAALANNTDVGTSEEAWGATATMSDPSGPVNVDALVVGCVANTTGSKSCDVWIDISDDGGSTWEAADVAQINRANVSSASIPRVPISALAFYTGTPSGDVHIRVRCQDVLGGGTGTVQVVFGGLTYSMGLAV